MQMPDAKIDDRLKEDIWRRDEFTCGLCGKMVPWEEVVIAHKAHFKGEQVNDPDNLLTVCAYCVEETKRAPPKEKEKRRLRMLLRELMTYTDFSEEVILEEDFEEQIVKLSKKLEELRRDCKLATDAVQEKEKVAIAYKVKMDRALKDLENFKKRAQNDIKLEVRERTKQLYMEIISSLDNIDRAIIEARKDEDIKQVKNTIEGLLSIRKGLLRSLESNGVEVLDPLSDPFDPREHESIGVVEDKEVFAETIVRVEMIGFKLDDMVLRPAKVLISKGGPKRSREDRPELLTIDFEFDEDIEEMEEAEEAGDVVEVGNWAGNGEEDILVVAKKRKKK
jgi:molecular chaperone GrpE